MDKGKESRVDSNPLEEAWRRALAELLRLELEIVRLEGWLAGSLAMNFLFAIAIVLFIMSGRR